MVNLRSQILPEGKQLLLEFNDSETQITQEAALPYFEYFRDKSQVAKRVGSILIGSLEVAEYRKSPLVVKLDGIEFSDFTREMLYVYYNRSRQLLDNRRLINPELPTTLQNDLDSKMFGSTQPKAFNHPMDKSISLRFLDKKFNKTYDLAKAFKYLAETIVEY